MRRLIAAINMTLDGFCDHTAGIPDDAMHIHYADLLRNSGIVLYGRITYQLMQYWQTLAKKPSGDKVMDEFAMVMDSIPKLVFSHTMENVDWQTAAIAKQDFKEEVVALKQQSGKDILVGSPSLIIEATKLKLIDEYQLCVHPVIIGSGLPLFKNINEKIILKLLKTKTFDSGAIVLYYEPASSK